MKENPLSFFHPSVQSWFVDTFGQASEVQIKAWPKIGSGQNCLICAPTGSGKTLAAFLWSIDRLLKRGKEESAANRVLYISPLKALNSDIEINLREPLKQLKQKLGDGAGDILVAVRSGDSSVAERRRQERETPDIFITTPESLAILMSRSNWPGLLSGIGTVIVDEVHSLAGNKRGAMLMTLLELLEWRNGPFQRLALSATVEPLAAVARWFAGFSGSTQTNTRSSRKIETVCVKGFKGMELDIDIPEKNEVAGHTQLGPWLREHIVSHKGVLVFANSRRQVERFGRLINESADHGDLVSVHHGSLSRDIRREVEKAFKNGRLKGVVATHSLELGIDIGTVDQVILIGTPSGVASAMQRIGRSGHQVNAVSRGLLLPRHRLDSLYGRVLFEMLAHGELEEIVPLENPLDVLAQLLLVILAAGISHIDDIYALLLRSAPYEKLEKGEVHELLELLSGRISGNQHKALVPRIHYDAKTGGCSLRKHARLLLFRASGVIPDRGYFILKRADNDMILGELDEEFVWERNRGDLFPFANQLWKIVNKDRNTVWVSPHHGAGGIIPFWRADANDRHPAFCRRLLDFFMGIEAHRSIPNCEHPALHCSKRVEDELNRLVADQYSAWGCLPSSRRVILEYHNRLGNPGDSSGEPILFTFRGAGVNRTLALVLEWLYQKKTGRSLQAISNNEGILFRVEEGPRVIGELLGEMETQHIPEALCELLPAGSLTAAVFREQAQISLLIPRSIPGQRGPLWWRRERSARLMEELGQTESCIMLESCWRETAKRFYAIDETTAFIRDWRASSIAMTVVGLDKPSPMAADLVWQHENEMMYKAEKAAPDAGPAWRLSAGFDGETLENPIPEDLSERFFLEKWRLLPGMEPDSLQELSLWLAERRFVPLELWKRMERQLSSRKLPGQEAFLNRAHALCSEEGALIGYCDGASTVSLLRLVNFEANRGKVVAFLLEWLHFFPLLCARKLSAYWAWPEESVRELISLLPREQLQRWSDGEGFGLNRVVEQLWQRTRMDRSKGLSALDAPSLYRFLDKWQKRSAPKSREDEDDVNLVFRFLLMPVPAALWMNSGTDGIFKRVKRPVLQELMNRYGILIRADNSERIAMVQHEDLSELPLGQTELLDPLEKDFDRVLQHSIGEFSSLDLLEQGLGSSHQQVLGLLRKFFFAGRIVCSQLEGVDVLLGRSRPEGASSIGYMSGRRSRTLARTQFGYTVSRGWRRVRTELPEEPSPLEKHEAKKEWIRLLLDRYGVFFPEILQHEWTKYNGLELRSVLSQMEWAGELVSGYFVKAARMPQYLSADALHAFSQKCDSGWQVVHSACPASLCGYAHGLFRTSFPFSRHHGWLVCENGHWGIALQAGGKSLRMNPRWKAERLSRALIVLRDWAGSSAGIGQRGHWIIDQIEYRGQDSDRLAEMMKDAGFTREMNQWICYC